MSSCLCVVVCWTGGGGNDVVVMIPGLEFVCLCVGACLGTLTSVWVFFFFLVFFAPSVNIKV